MQGMVEMAEYPDMTCRNGSINLYYKRPVLKELCAPGRREQVWRSSKSIDPNVAKAAYRVADAETEAQFDEQCRED